MVIFGIFVVAFLVMCFFYCLKKRKTRKTQDYFDTTSWILNFFAYGVAGVLLGSVISFAIGKFVPGKSVLIETCVLEPVIAEGKEIFAIKNKKSSLSFSSYFYFTKSELNDCPLEVNSILLEERDVRFGGNIRTVNKYRIKLKGNLKWFFFSNNRTYSELVLLSNKDIL